ncbi:glycosyltransferase family 2 protein [Flavobacterium sp. N2038]|uniref:glycosyltransferase family 2 protein n=1 Tax=Flavobacterium sp. N2038 TaxID=2986829 RepID=UPI002224609A|nr:glycosyltransferase family A protein [Flavobacterium sp. N2038]
MGHKNLVSIVIATYNRANLIAETLESVLAQTYENWECIIVDDGSSDNTEEVVAKYTTDERIRFFKRPEERIKGPNASRNYGIENSFGEFIMSLDSDDWILSDYLQKKIEIFQNQPEVDGVLSKTIMVNNEKEIIKKELRTKITNNLLEDFISLNISWYMHDILWRRSFLQDKILYNERLLKMLDRDFHIRRLIEEPNLFLVDEYLALYRIHENSNSSNSDYNVAESRHKAILQIVGALKKENKLSDRIKFYLFKHQVQNLIVLYKHPKCIELYLNLIGKTFNFSLEYLKWLLKFSIGYVSFKLTKRGLRFIQ